MDEDRPHRPPPAAIAGIDARLRYLERRLDGIYGIDGVVESVARLREAQRLCNMRQEAEARRRSIQVTILASVMAGMLVALVTHALVKF
jgi:hypothetical protein